MYGSIPIKLIVNGERHSLKVKPSKRLIDVLRDDLGLTSVKECCGIGECGACTVLVDGLAINSCLMLAVEADGKSVLTAEGLADDGSLDPLQEAFLEKGAVQCGFCIPGQLMAAKYLLSRNPNPTREEVKEGMAGNLCRCGGYERIIDAILAVGRNSAKEEKK